MLRNSNVSSDQLRFHSWLTPGSCKTFLDVQVESLDQDSRLHLWRLALFNFRATLLLFRDVNAFFTAENGWWIPFAFQRMSFYLTHPSMGIGNADIVLYSQLFRNFLIYSSHKLHVHETNIAIIGCERGYARRLYLFPIAKIGWSHQA